MLSFTAASEPGEILVETPQYKVFQCVAMDFLCFFRVQIQMLEFLCIFGFASLAAYTVAPRQSRRCLVIWYFEI